MRWTAFASQPRGEDLRESFRWAHPEILHEEFLKPLGMSRKDLADHLAQRSKGH